MGENVPVLFKEDMFEIEIILGIKINDASKNKNMR